MALKAEEKLKVILEYDKDHKERPKFRAWFLKQFEKVKANDGYDSLEEFALYFLNALRQHTESHLKVSSGNDTPKCQTPVKTQRSNVNDEDAGATKHVVPQHLQILSTPNQSLRNDVSQASMGDWTSNSQARLSTSVDRSGTSQRNLTSTPVRRNVSGNSKRLSTTPGSANKSGTSLCLGDFLVMNTTSGSHNRSHNKKKNTSGTTATTPQTTNEKPKKRVQPISISKKVEKAVGQNSVFAGESSFSHENNILKISHTEIEDEEQCSIWAARKILKSKASEIARELVVSPSLASVPAAVVATSTPSKRRESLTMDEVVLDFEHLAGKNIIQRLADIYVVLIDTHLTTNFLNELSFLLNLLNASPTSAQTSLAEAFKTLELHETENASLKYLEDARHAVYFALQCLNEQKLRLGSLDAKTLKVIFSNENFAYLEEGVRCYLLETYQKKQQMLSENPMHETSICFESKPCNNVYFQQDQDSRQNFTSHQEFAKFRAQRDLFCKCLQMWETNHLNPNWKFSVEVTPKIREIFHQSEHCVNMAHFAKLFVSQLLLSASSATSPEEIGLDMDMQKLSKLTQRLIAPSQFSVDYQFPRAQAFFRDFILKARSLAFAEQLKMELYSQLILLNNSSFDHINITMAETEADNHDDSLLAEMGNEQVAVRPEILNSMLILAKFLGFTISLPFVCNAGPGHVMPSGVEKKQLRLRALTQPNFDLHLVLQEGIEQGKLLITIPWMAQYICMLDSISLQLEIYTKVLDLLFALYWFLGSDGGASNTILPSTSKFIITSCLGWLFDSQQFLIEQYYQYRSVASLEGHGNELDYVKSKLTKAQDNNDDDGRGEKNSSKEFMLNPLLESLLPVACPFLAEFRVSIMPAKYAQTKYASRSGRYRHITTRVAELSPTTPTPTPREGELSVDSPAANSKAIQNNLIQAFRKSQNSSTRQIIIFCSERVYKCVVKDGQLKILLPAKSHADSQVNKITSSCYHTVYREIEAIYGSARQTAISQWNEEIPKMLEKRISNCLDSLLPEETPDILKRTYLMMIKKDAQHKVSQWFYANLIKDNYFCVDLDNVANKLCSADKTKQPSELRILKETPSVSELIDTLQYWLHCTSVRTELFKDSKPLVDLMQTMIDSFDNDFPTILYRLMASNIIQLLQHIVTANSDHLTTELMEAACQVLMHNNVRRALDVSHNTAEENNSPTHSIYDSLITIPFLLSLACRTECYAKFGLLLSTMIEKQIISLNYTNNLFIGIFKHDWHPAQLNEISNMLKNVAQRTLSLTKTRSAYAGVGDAAEKENEGEDDDDDEKSNLFMDMLADLSRDVDFY
ncbi:protein disks lost [Stomoxys calcitrans]|uniref:protein disks lost n=1 Tax=Stomoxys calcitrans TaxID=35570 RepID=UPI0027E33D62|nr:protein disks lost [Stomoxys calcitrans]